MTLRPYALLVLFVIYALGCWLFFQPMLIELHGHWIRPNDLDAGYLLLAVTLYLYWHFGRDSDQAAVQSDQASQYPAAAPVRVIACLAFIIFLLIAALAALTATKSVALGLLVFAFVPLAAGVLGLLEFRRALHGSAILSMATPIWFVIVPALQALTASAVNWLLQRGRWPVYVEDNLIFLPQGALEVAAGCAGLKFVQTALTLTLIEGFLARRSFRTMALIGLVAFGLALLCNWLRVAAITLLALYLDLQHPWVMDHNWVGWVVFVLLFGPFFYWLGRFGAAPGAPVKEITPPSTSNKLPGALGGVLSLALGFSAVWLVNSSVGGDASQAMGQSQLEAARAFCKRSERTLEHPAPAAFAGAQLKLDCSLGDQHYLSLRGYLAERQGSEVISPENKLIPGLGQLDFAVANDWSEAKENAENLNPQYGLHRHPKLSIAYGYSAARQWTPEPSTYKVRSLARPFYPGPVWALVIIAPPGERPMQKAAQTFEKIAASVTLAASSASPSPN